MQNLGNKVTIRPYQEGKSYVFFVLDYSVLR